MDKINEASDDDEADQLRSRFTLVISTDYQMSKLTPHWGYSPQPGSTYYLQKLSHNLLGIVNHSEEASTAVYLMSAVDRKTQITLYRTLRTMYVKVALSLIG